MGSAARRIHDDVTQSRNVIMLICVINFTPWRIMFITVRRRAMRARNIKKRQCRYVAASLRRRPEPRFAIIVRASTIF